MASQAASTGRPSGSTVAHTCRVTCSPLAAAMAVSVPSPPSAIGICRIVSSGRIEAQPRAMASAAATESSAPPNESGATTTRRAGLTS